MSKRKWNVTKNSTRRGYMSLPMQVQSRLCHFKTQMLSLVAAHVFSVVMVSRLFGISRTTFYQYRHQAEQGSLASCDCTPRVHGSRMVKKLMRPRARSISGAPQAVRDTEWGLHTLRLG